MRTKLSLAVAYAALMTVAAASSSATAATVPRPLTTQQPLVVQAHLCHSNCVFSGQCHKHGGSPWCEYKACSASECYKAKKRWRAQQRSLKRMHKD